MKKFIVEKSLKINAPALRVWEVLVKPQFIKRWDDLPEDFDFSRDFEVGSEIKRKEKKDNHSKLTVTALEPTRLFKLALYSSDWALPEESYDISYNYTLSELDDSTLIWLIIGDFKKLPNAKELYDSATKFADLALERIKTLAEDK